VKPHRTFEGKKNERAGLGVLHEMKIIKRERRKRPAENGKKKIVEHEGEADLRKKAPEAPTHPGKGRTEQQTCEGRFSREKSLGKIPCRKNL